jgi:hypothetical protein
MSSRASIWGFRVASPSSTHLIDHSRPTAPDQPSRTSHVLPALSLNSRLTAIGALTPWPRASSPPWSVSCSTSSPVAGSPPGRRPSSRSWTTWRPSTTRAGDTRRWARSPSLPSRHATSLKAPRHDHDRSNQASAKAGQSPTSYSGVVSILVSLATIQLGSVEPPAVGQAAEIRKGVHEWHVATWSSSPGSAPNRSDRCTTNTPHPPGA